MAETINTRRFGRYQLDRLIGRGGMGEIYLAQMEGSAGFKKPVCIKKILPHLSREKEFVTRFIDEAHIVVTLMHGNIVQVLDMGEVEGEYFIAMEYVPGRDLRDIARRYRKRGEQMSPPLVAYIVAEICKALSYAHKKTDEQGKPLHIIHRDVSPSNVLVSREGVIKLTDFGIAKAVGKLGKSITGRLQGKFCYMSPEQAAGRSVDHRSDIFSVASITYELLTGVRPFEADSDLATLEAVRKANTPALTAVRADLPEGLNDVLARALTRNPDDRYTDAADFARELGEAILPSTIATDSDVAVELSRLFPGEEAAFVTPSRGMGLDEALALEVDRMLQASPYGESPTITADVQPDDAQRVVQEVVAPVQPAAGLVVGLGSTPTPSIPQFTPTPMSEYAYPVATRRRRWTPVVVAIFLMAAVAAVLLWVEPAYLLMTTLHVDCTPSSAEVLIDNEAVGRCGVTKSVDAGLHRVTVRTDGYLEQETEVDLQRGEERFVELTLREDPRIETTVWVQPDVGRFRIQGVDDERWHRSGERVLLEPGEYEVTVQASEHQTITEHLRFAEGEELEVKLERVVEEIAVVENGGSEPDAGEPTDVTIVEPEVTESEVPPERPAEVTFELTVIPADAQLFVDGEERSLRSGGRFRQRFEHDNRTISILVTREGYRDGRMTFNPGRSGDTDETIELEPIPQMREVRIWLDTPAVGDLYIDGESFGEAPQTVELEIGRTYRVLVVNDSTRSRDERDITVRAGNGFQGEGFFPPR